MHLNVQAGTAALTFVSIHHAKSDIKGRRWNQVRAFFATGDITRVHEGIFRLGAIIYIQLCSTTALAFCKCKFLAIVVDASTSYVWFVQAAHVPRRFPDLIRSDYPGGRVRMNVGSLRPAIASKMSLLRIESQPTRRRRRRRREEGQEQEGGILVVGISGPQDRIWIGDMTTSKPSRTCMCAERTIPFYKRPGVSNSVRFAWLANTQPASGPEGSDVLGFRWGDVGAAATGCRDGPCIPLHHPWDYGGRIPVCVVSVLTEGRQWRVACVTSTRIASGGLRFSRFSGEVPTSYVQKYARGPHSRYVDRPALVSFHLFLPFSLLLGIRQG